MFFLIHREHMRLLQRHQKQLEMLRNDHLVSISGVSGGRMMPTSKANSPQGPPRPRNPGSGAVGHPDSSSQHAGLNLKRKPGPSASAGAGGGVYSNRFTISPHITKEKKGKEIAYALPCHLHHIHWTPSLYVFKLLFVGTMDVQMCIITYVWAVCR